MIFQAWKLVLLNSMTVHDRETPSSMQDVIQTWAACKVIGKNVFQNQKRKKADLYLRGVRERLRCSGLFDAERDFDLRAGDVLRFTLV